MTTHLSAVDMIQTFERQIATHRDQTATDPAFLVITLAQLDAVAHTPAPPSEWAGFHESFHREKGTWWFRDYPLMVVEVANR